VKAVASALARNLETLAEQATDDRHRLAAIETQTQALAEAVIAITNRDKAVRPGRPSREDSMKGGGINNRPDSEPTS